MPTDSPDILLVEDNPNDVRLTLHALQPHGLVPSVVVVRDGAEALDYLFCAGTYTERLREARPKVILLDLKLPLVDGAEVLRRIKADPRSRMIPVVILSTSREERDIAQSYQLGANSYIVKPIDFDEFADAMQQVGRYWLHWNQSV